MDNAQQVIADLLDLQCVDLTVDGLRIEGKVTCDGGYFIVQLLDGTTVFKVTVGSLFDHPPFEKQVRCFREGRWKDELRRAAATLTAPIDDKEYWMKRR